MEKLSRTTEIVAALNSNATSFAILLTIIFCILRWCGVIELHWAWVFSPLWIRLISMVVGFFVCLIIESTVNGKAYK